MKPSKKHSRTFVTSIESLKRRAKQIKRERGVDHAKALNIASQICGFPNYKIALRDLKDPSRSLKNLTAHGKFMREARSSWAEAILQNPEENLTTWTDLAEIAGVLHSLLSQTENYCFLPESGGFKFDRASLGHEGRSLALGHADSSTIRLFFPDRLELHRTSSSLAESFFLLHLAQAPSLPVIVPDEQTRTGLSDPTKEVVLMDEAGTYYDMAYMDLPGNDAKDQVIRFQGGKMMIVSKGSFWNSLPRAHSALHETTPEPIMRAIIETLISANGYAT